MRSTMSVVLLVTLGLVFACERPVETESDIETERGVEQPEQEDELVEPRAEVPHAVGETSRKQIVELHPDWSADRAAEPDESAAKALAEVEPWAEVTVFLGTWCSDSRREVPRFWRALDLAGDVPFEVNYVGLDRQFEAGDVSLEGKNIVAVPTFVVYRKDEEVGRVVETSVSGIEADVLSLLVGEASGMISASRE